MTFKTNKLSALSALSIICGISITDSALAAEKFCVGSFESTSYASVFGLARYAVFCDDGTNDSVQSGFSYSKSAQDKLYNDKAIPMIKKMGLNRIQTRTDNNFGSHDYYRASDVAPTQIATVYRFVSKRRGVFTESIELRIDGRRTQFPLSTVSSTQDYSNLDKIVSQEGMNRSNAILLGYDSSGPELYILYR